MNSRTSGSPSHRRLLLLLPVAFTGFLSILASDTFDEGNEGQRPRTAVSFVLGSLATPLTRDIGVRIATLTNIRFAGEYAARVGDTLTLDRDVLDLDTTSGFDFTLQPEDPDDLLAGDVRVDVTATLDFGLSRDPTRGQFASQAAGTTTLVTAQTGPDGVNVEVGGAPAQFFGWTDFEDLVEDENAALDLRFASSAYAQLQGQLQLALLAEEILQSVGDNEATLESMGLGSPLELACDNGANESSGERALIWRTDAPGSGAGQIGAGDGFEARFDNCFIANRNRYFEGTVLLDDVVFGTGDSPRSLAVEADFGTLFLSESEISISTVPDPVSPRLDGGLDLNYDEEVLATP